MATKVSTQIKLSVQNLTKKYDKVNETCRSIIYYKENMLIMAK